MRPITLVLITPQGDELGRLRLDAVQVAPPGQAGRPHRPDLARQMDDLHTHIQEALDREGVAPASDAIDVRIAVSRALLTPDAGEILIPLTVREATAQDRPRADAAPRLETSDDNALPGSAEDVSGRGEADDLPAWDDLFDLNALDAEGWDRSTPAGVDETPEGRERHV